RGVTKNRIGDALAGHAGRLAEEQRENNHGEQRLDHRPRHAEGRLPIAYLNLAPREEIQQFAVPPELDNGIARHLLFLKLTAPACGSRKLRRSRWEHCIPSRVTARARETCLPDATVWHTGTGSH